MAALFNLIQLTKVVPVNLSSRSRRSPKTWSTWSLPAAAPTWWPTGPRSSATTTTTSRSASRPSYSAWTCSLTQGYLSTHSLDSNNLGLNFDKFMGAVAKVGTRGETLPLGSANKWSICLIVPSKICPSLTPLSFPPEPNNIGPISPSYIPYGHCFHWIGPNYVWRGFKGKILVIGSMG